MKQISIIGIVGLPANYGGFESFAEQLVGRMEGRAETTVYCSSSAYPQKRDTYLGAKLKYFPLNANGASSILYDACAMFAAIRKSDTLLILGVSGCIFLPFARLLRRKTRIVVNVDGIEWRRAKWGRLARWFLRFSEGCAVRNADCVIADNKVIADYLGEKYGIVTETIEYGADHVTPVPIVDETRREFPFLNESYAFSVLRIEPENNVSMILEAFHKGLKLPLVMVGNWHSSELGRSLRAKYASDPNLHLLDPIYEPGKLNQLRSNCRLYIHGHSCGGTNPSLVEAMWLGLSIVAFDVSFNRVTTEDSALYFKDSEALAGIVDTIDEARCRTLSQSMKEIALRRYTWRHILDRYAGIL